MSKRTIKRRRKEGKTDYKARLVMLKSGKPRVVIRRTNKYIIVQYVESHEAQDKVIVGANSKELLKKGWSGPKGGLKSLKASYETGKLAGEKILAKLEDKEQEVILDIGLQRNISGNRLYAALKGLIDAGVNIKHNEKALPSDERISGKSLEKIKQTGANAEEKKKEEAEGEEQNE